MFPQGLLDSVRTYGFWFQTSGNANVYSWTKYFEWLGKAEAPVMILGGVGVIVALVQARNRFAVFSAFWSMGILSAYCLVPYKTPWLALSIVLPFVIMGGYALEQIYEQWNQRTLAMAVLSLAVIGAASQAIDLSFFRYDDESEPYSYAHTRRDFLKMVNEVETIAAGNPAGKNIGITIMSPEHWPLPWYLRNYPRTLYSGKVIETSEPVLVVHESQLAEVEQMYGGRYRRYSRHELRPGNILYLYPAGLLRMRVITERFAKSRVVEP